MTGYAGNGSAALGNFTRVGAGNGTVARDIQRIYAGNGSSATLVWQAFSFSSHTDTFAGGESGNAEIPQGASQLIIRAYGPGVKGEDAIAADSDWLPGDGGDGGNKVTKTVAIAEADWLSTLAYSVGTSASYANTTISGTVTAGAISIASGTGGTHSGGDSFSTGGSGQPGSGSNGGTGGAGGTGIDGHCTGGQGADGFENATGSDGDDGWLELEWS